LRALLGALAHPGAPGAEDFVSSFVGSDDPLVRLDAYRALFAHTEPAKAQRAIEKALADPEPRVAAFAVEEAERRGGPALTKALGRFAASRVGPAAAAEARRRSVEALAKMGSDEARQELGAIVAARCWTFSLREIRIARLAAEALEASGDPAGLAAARRWRRFPAGWLASIVGRG
jgi:hypothetical protein